jgi:hypothetical protein
VVGIDATLTDGRTYVRIGTSGTRHGEFQTALRTGSFRLALQVARDLPRLTLADALRLTLLAARHEPSRYPEMARRWLARLMVERPPSLDQLTWATALLSIAPRDETDEDRLAEVLSSLL